LSSYSSHSAWGPSAGQKNLVTPSQLPQVIPGLRYTIASHSKGSTEMCSNLQSSRYGNLLNG